MTIEQKMSTTHNNIIGIGKWDCESLKWVLCGNNTDNSNNKTILLYNNTGYLLHAQ